MSQSLLSKMPNSGTILRTVLDHFRKVGQRGATVDETASAIKQPHQRVSPTVSSLKCIGFLEPKGKATRLSELGSPMTVYVLTLPATEELRHAGYAVTNKCQCSRKPCHGHNKTVDCERVWCDKDATEQLETTLGTILMCLDCAIEFPSDHIISSKSLEGQ